MTSSTWSKYTPSPIFWICRNQIRVGWNRAESSILERLFNIRIMPRHQAQIIQKFAFDNQEQLYKQQKDFILNKDLSLEKQSKNKCSDLCRKEKWCDRK
jgi:hypothetical protein